MSGYMLNISVCMFCCQSVHVMPRKLAKIKCTNNIAFEYKIQLVTQGLCLSIYIIVFFHY